MLKRGPDCLFGVGGYSGWPESRWRESTVIVLSDEPRQNQGRGLVDRKLVKAPQ